MKPSTISLSIEYPGESRARAAVSNRSQSNPLFDHLVGAREQQSRNLEPGVTLLDVTWIALRKPPTTGRQERFHVGGMAMVRATVVRALVVTAAFAAASTPVTCLGENSNQLPTRATKELPTKATKELPPELLSLLRQKKMPKHSPILVRIFKEEAELEVWKQDTTGHFEYPQDLSDLPVVGRSWAEVL